MLQVTGSTYISLLIIHCAQDCNPYGNNEIIKISLDCIVRVMLPDEFEIRWFRENKTGAVEDLGHGFPNGSLGKRDWFSRYHESDFFNRQYNPSYLGKYWCQVINTTADPDQPLMRSNVFTLLAPENYTQPTCSQAIQTVINSTCADLSVPSEPAPTTTLSSSSYWKLPDCATTSEDVKTGLVTVFTDHTSANATSGNYVQNNFVSLCNSTAVLGLITTMTTATGTTSLLSSTSYIIFSPASPTANVLPIVYSIAAVLSAVIVIVSVIAVTVILLLVKRQRRKG